MSCTDDVDSVVVGSLTVLISSSHIYMSEGWLSIAPELTTKLSPKSPWLNAPRVASQ
jgi:hypothetical protein